LLHQFARRESSARHGLLHVGDGGLHDVEFARRRFGQRRKQQNDQQSLLHCASHNPIAAAHAAADVVLSRRYSQK
jgi:hypothetical protein